MSSNIVEVIRNIAQMEIKKVHTTELGIVTSVFPHASDTDKDNYECNIRLKDKGVELRKVPVATQQIGFVNILHTGDLGTCFIYWWKYQFANNRRQAL